MRDRQDRTCRRVEPRAWRAATPAVLLACQALLAANALAEPPRVSLGIAETLSREGDGIAFRVRTADGTAPGEVLRLLRNHPEFDHHRRALEAAHRHGRRILVGWRTDGRTVDWALAATGAVVQHREERNGSIAAPHPGRCLVVSAEVVRANECDMVDPAVLAAALRAYGQGGEALPHDLAAPLFLGTLFFQRTNAYRQLLSSWVRDLEETEIDADESLLLALAHPILAELLKEGVARAQGPSRTHEAAGRGRQLKLEAALEVVRRRLEGRAPSPQRFHFDPVNLRHGLSTRRRDRRACCGAPTARPHRGCRSDRGERRAGPRPSSQPGSR